MHTFKAIVGAAEKLGHHPHGDGVGFGAQTADDYLKCQAAFIRKQVANRVAPSKTAPFESDEVRDVYINEGRLLVDCSCGDGVFVHVLQEIAACFTCGAIYRRAVLRFPPNLDAIDEVCAGLPMHHRNIRPTVESLDSIRLVRLFTDVIQRPDENIHALIARHRAGGGQ